LGSPTGAKKEDHLAIDGQDEGHPDFPPGASEEEKLLIQIKEIQLYFYGEVEEGHQGFT